MKTKKNNIKKTPGRKRSLREIEFESELLNAVNNVSSILLEPDIDKFQENLHKSMGLIAQAVDVDRVYIWQNHTIDGKLYMSQLYEWSENAEPQQGNEYTVNVPYEDSEPELLETFLRGDCINGIVREMPARHRNHLEPQGVVSIILVPVFLHEDLWGFVGFDDCHKERIFSKNEEIILRSASRMITNALMRQSMSQNLQNALEIAEAASKAKGNFLSTMSHEMRTPMNAIIGMTVIGKKAEDIEGKNRALNKIGEASTHLLGIINDVLDMAKIEANKLELVAVEFNFRRMLNKVISVITFKTDEKNQKIILNIDDKIPRNVIGDDQRLSQVIANLLSNAVKFSPENSKIFFNATLMDNMDTCCQLQMEVIDHGIGISPQQQEKLFQAFEQGKSGTSRVRIKKLTPFAFTPSSIFLKMALPWNLLTMKSRATYFATTKAALAPMVAPTSARMPPSTEPKVMPAIMVNAAAGSMNTATSTYSAINTA